MLFLWLSIGNGNTFRVPSSEFQKKKSIMERLPDKTVERLSKYRRALLNSLLSGKEHIFSHEIAALLHITPVQVRRDLMLIGYTGTLRKGYDVTNLIEKIGQVLDTLEGQRVAIFGLGNLGRALINYFSGKRTKLTIVAAFDTNPEKTNKEYHGVMCYDFDRVDEILKQENVSIGIITVPGASTRTVAEKILASGIKGILNFSSYSLNCPEVYLEEYDMITSLEKVAYFAKRD